MEDYDYYIKHIKNMLGEDEESFIDLIKTFLQYTPESLNELVLNINENNLDEVAKISHRMIPGFSFFGLNEVVEKLTTIENMAKNKQNPDYIKDLIYECKKIIENFLKYLKKEFNL